MRILSLKDIMLNKDYYALEPGIAQAITVLTYIPTLLKFFFGLIVDSRFVSNRKYYLIFFGFTGAVS